MDYIRCTCSTNQWLSHSLKINREDHTWPVVWARQLSFGKEVRIPATEEISLYPEASYPTQW